ncbi:MAG: hypothetical protein GXP62_16735 [Oligoflexia bacterium]|nr:hypothetical protein [Oligoflexia bacterium]
MTTSAEVRTQIIDALRLDLVGRQDAPTVCAFLVQGRSTGLQSLDLETNP